MDLITYAMSKNYTNKAIDESILSVYRYKGSVESYFDLPYDAVIGDVYNVTDREGQNFAWNGEDWDALGGDNTYLIQLINEKQDQLIFDNEPQESSTNPVTSDGIKKALNNISKTFPTKLSQLENDTHFIIASQEGENQKFLNEQGEYVHVNTNQSFPQTLVVDGSTEEFLESIINSNPEKGTSYLGGVSLTDMPADLRYAECYIDVIASGSNGSNVLYLELYSTDTKPYKWYTVYWEQQGFNGWIPNVLNEDVEIVESKLSQHIDTFNHPDKCVDLNHLSENILIDNDNLIKSENLKDNQITLQNLDIGETYSLFAEGVIYSFYVDYEGNTVTSNLDIIDNNKYTFIAEHPTLILITTLESNKNIAYLTKGVNFPQHIQVVGQKKLINQQLLESIYAEIQYQKNRNDIIDLGITQDNSSNQYNIESNNIYKILINNDIGFILPQLFEFNTNIYNKIIIQAEITKPVIIDWGTEYFFDGIIVQANTGNYTFTYECDNGKWYLKSEMKGSADTTIKAVKVIVSGEYEGINDWENAYYSFEVTNGVAADSGWLSNGKYKFHYTPETSIISGSPAFALEEGQEIPERIVIPYSIEAFTTGYNSYTSMQIQCYAANVNFGIFRYNESANAQIIIPEGTIALNSNLFAQCSQNNNDLKFILPQTLKTIGSNCFFQSSAGAIYKDIILPSNLESIGTSCFSNCRFTQMIIPNKITIIPNTAFAFCMQLNTIIFEGNITTINSNAFRKCKSLKEIYFKGNVAPTTIDTLAFNEINLTEERTLTVYYPANGVGYDSEEFTNKFPTGTVFIEEAEIIA